MYNILLKKEMSLKKKFLFTVNNFTSPAFHRRHFTVSEKKIYIADKYIFCVSIKLINNILRYNNINKIANYCEIFNFS